MYLGPSMTKNHSSSACIKGVVALFLELQYSFSPYVDQVEFLLSCPYSWKGEAFPEILHYEGGYLSKFFPLEVSSFLPPS